MADNSINTSLSALKAYQTMINNTAGNVANSNTANFSPFNTDMQSSPTGGVTAQTSRGPVDQVDLSKEMVDLIIARNGMKANIRVMKTTQEVQKNVIDLLA